MFAMNRATKRYTYFNIPETVHEPGNPPETYVLVHVELPGGGWGIGYFCDDKTWRDELGRVIVVTGWAENVRRDL